jgi:hypothetical protein
MVNFTTLFLYSLSTPRRAIIDQLESPSPGFEDVIRLHFRLKKEKVIQQTNEWIQLNKENQHLHDKLHSLLSKL